MRRTWLVCGALLALFAATLSAATRPNVLVILVDDMGWSDISPYGGEIYTPTLETLATGGLRFRHFYNEARCSPTRIALMTGLHMQSAAVDPNASLPNLRTDNNVTIPELLSAHGYRTYFSGKWHLGTLANGRDPVSRGFQHGFGQGVNADGAGGDYWGDGTTYGLVSTTGEITPTNYPAGTFYKTDANVDYVLKYLDHHFGKHDGAPFFIYLAHNAPHFRLQAPADYINKYTDVADANPSDADVYRYEDGWDLTRQRRYERQLADGVIEPHYRLSPKGYENVGKLDIPDWSTLPADRRNDLARRMAVYAAMVSKVDESIARIVSRLQAEGELDNTLIFFFSDNGGNSEGGLYGRTGDQNNSAPLTGNALETMGLSGGALLHLGGGWANVNNTPLRFFKHHTHEGGCRTPLIIHWPEGMADEVKGKWTNERGHAIDIMATILDAAGIAYPSAFEGHSVLPLAGMSLRPALQGGHLPERDLFIEHERNRAMFRGPWKLVTKSFTQGGIDLPVHALELYNLQADPSELNTAAFHDTILLSNMIASWNAWTASLPGLNANRSLSPKGADTSRFAMPNGRELFYDTFSRSDAMDLDAERGGMSGTVAGMNLAPVNSTYFQGFGSNRMGIVGGRLRMALTSAGMSENGLMFNFAGPEIIRAGGFSVEMTVTELNSTTTQGTDRYAGIGVGLTRAEASQGADISNAASFRGRADLTNGLADFFVDLDMEGNLKVWAHGKLLETVPVGKTTGTILAAFKLNAGFAAGDSVEVHVFLDGTLADINSVDDQSTSRSFSWENSDANYIGVSARTTGYAELDNLIIRPFPLRDALCAQYALESGLNGSDTQVWEDPDADGLDTFAEWFWGTDPAVSDAKLAAIRLLREPGPQFVLGHRRVRNSSLMGIIYPVRCATSVNLPPAQWMETATSEMRTVPLANSPQHEWVERSVPRSLTDAAPSLFLSVQCP